MMTPLRPASRTRCTSSRLATPPEAMTRRPVARANSAVASTLTPLLIPSRLMSVKMSQRPPISAQRCANSRAWRGAASRQPRICTTPSRASMPTATRSAPNSSKADASSAGRSTATVPSTTRATPNASAWRIASKSRRPPPNCTRGPTSTTRAKASKFRRSGEPPFSDACSPSPNAPSRLTTCSQSAPASAQRRATAAGSLAYSVSRSGSPWRNRTTRPPRRSMAGKMVNESIITSNFLKKHLFHSTILTRYNAALDR